MKERSLWAALVSVAVLIAIIWVGVFGAASDCRETGGVPVRGVFGIECIQQCEKGGK